MGQFDWMRQNQMRAQQQQRSSTPAPQADTSSMNAFLQGGHLPGVGGSRNQNAELASIYGNMGAQNQQNLDAYTKQMQGLFGQNPLSQWQNPYGNAMNQTFKNMGNAPSTQQSATSWMNQFNPMMQQGGQMNFANPQLQQTQMNPNVTNFMNQNSAANVYGAPSLGVGGQVAANIAQMQQPQGGGNPLGGQAGQQWMTGLGSLLNQPGMTQGQMDMAARGIIDPTSRAIGKKQEQDLSGASARGLGRSSEYGRIVDDNTGRLSDVISSTYGGLTQQNIGLQNQNRLAALSGLGQAQGQFTGQDLQGQGLAQNWLGNQANIGLGLAGLGQQGQLATNQLNQGASNDAFGQNATRAGMGMDLYNADANRALQLLNSDRGYDTQTQGMMADNQYRNANMNNQNLLSLLGMGGQAGQQDFSNQSAILQGLLGAGGQNLSAWGQGQGNALNLMGMQGNMLNSIYGNQYGNYTGDRNFYEGMRQYGQNRQDGLDAAQGPGFWEGLGGNMFSNLTNGTIFGDPNQFNPAAMMGLF